MAICYQHDANKYYVGDTDDYGGPLPNNCTDVAPTIQAGFIPQWDGSGWIQVENHIGEDGYVNGVPTTIKDYGPYPDGWSTTPPPPTPDELQNQFNAVVNTRLETFATSPYNDTDIPFDSMDKARLAALTPDLKSWGDIANWAYDTTWAKADTLLPQVRNGALAVDAAVAELPALAWDSELAKIQVVQAKYAPQLDKLRQAHMAALILGDTDDATAIQTEYSNMLQAMATEIAAITG